MPETESPSDVSLSGKDYAAIVAVLLIHAGMLAWGAYRHSPTIDEPAYLASGVSHWKYGRFDLCKVSPPLVRLVAAIPVCLVPHEENWGSYKVGAGVRSEHAVGRDFMVVNGRRTMWLFTLGRWACIPFSWIGACTCFKWGLDLWGRRSAWVAMLLWCCSPNILAHGQMLTPDIGVTALSLAAAYASWTWTLRPGWGHAAAAGVLLGLSVLAKTNAVILFGILPVVSLVAVIAQAGTVRRFAIMATQWAMALMIGIYVINLGFGFEGTLRRLDHYEFASQTFRGPSDKAIGNRFDGTLLGMVPVPFPQAFLEGIDLQRRDFENGSGRTKTYWRGVWYDHSWWWYYLYATGVKVPLGLFALLLLSFAVQMRLGQWTKSLAIVIPCIALFAIASSQTGFGHAVRYVLPAFPFAFVFASGAVQDSIRSRVTLIIASACLVASIVSSLLVYPHSLAYFNELAGGPRNGHAHLLDGNLDWGQDLLYLEKWIAEHPEARPIHVGYWGIVPIDETLGQDLSQFDFRADEEPPEGWYAISVNHLRRDFRMGEAKYEPFLNRQPVGMAGYSIYIYHILSNE